MKKSIYYCDNTKCPDHINEEEETERKLKFKGPGNPRLSGCDWLNPKGTKSCDKRKNPDNIPCQSCGTAKYVIQTKLGPLCGRCRGSYTQHLHLVQRLGGQPRLASTNEPINTIYNE